MVHPILVSHGSFAAGMREAMDMIAGGADRLSVLGLYPGDTVENFARKLEDIVDSYADPRSVLILADLPLGTPANVAKAMALKKGVSVVSGCSLPVLLEAMSRLQEETAESLAAIITQAGRDSVENFADVREKADEK